MIKRSYGLAYRLSHPKKEKFECPICHYQGPLEDIRGASGFRKHARCPRCRSLERHRLQFLVLSKVLEDLKTKEMRMLHFAPEGALRVYFSNLFESYETADIAMEGVDHLADLQKLPFADATYDFVFASHVLEHVPDDDKAISEIRRILKPAGIALLPVPVVADRTIEYPRANPREHYHVRAPGTDYFERMRRHFSSVELIASDMLPERYQLYVFEDRTQWPTEQCPYLKAMSGEKHKDFIPVCRA